MKSYLPASSDFQQDGVTVHRSAHVRSHLDSRLQYPSISRGYPIAWPPKSSSLTSSEFLLWKNVRDIVFSVEGTSQTPIEKSIKNLEKVLALKSLNPFANYEYYK